MAALAGFRPLALLSCTPAAGKIRDEAPELRRPLGEESRGVELVRVSTVLKLLAGCTTELLSGFSTNDWMVGGISSHICHHMAAQSATGERATVARHATCVDQALTATD